MPKFIIDGLSARRSPQYFIIVVSAAVLVNGLLTIINAWMSQVIGRYKGMMLKEHFILHLGKKIMNMDFEDLEDPQILDQREKAVDTVNDRGSVWGLIGSITFACTQFVTLAGFIVLLTTLSPLLVLFIILIIVANMRLYKNSQKIEFEFNQKLTVIGREHTYYKQLTSDFTMGKDVRIYKIRDLIMDKINSFYKASFDIIRKQFRTVKHYDGIINVNTQVQSAIVYAYMTFMVLVKGMTIGNFSMYVGAANGFSSTLSNLLSSLVWLRQLSTYLEKYMEFDEIPSRSTKEGLETEGIRDCEIEFCNVSFKYPKGSDYVLKNVSIKISKGKKLSVVGMNGSGKTTFIKLLARLYEPDEGEIRINGTNIKEYRYEDYQKLLSIVFQDFKLLAFSIKENVTLKDESTDDAGVTEALQKAGLWEDVQKLSQGINTYIYKVYEQDGIEFSGGQGQKLALARAIYKNSPIVILDEPTAALDPIAEFEVYKNFNEIVGDKTAIYISHRLSSCRFCDDIAVFHNGQLIQRGNHNALIGDEKGKYYELWNAQAQYYTES